jgi:hypothetical protein
MGAPGSLHAIPMQDYLKFRKKANFSKFIDFIVGDTAVPPADLPTDTRYPSIELDKSWDEFYYVLTALLPPGERLPNNPLTMYSDVVDYCPTPIRSWQPADIVRTLGAIGNLIKMYQMRYADFAPAIEWLTFTAAPSISKPNTNTKISKQEIVAAPSIQLLSDFLIKAGGRAFSVADPPPKSYSGGSLAFVYDYAVNYLILTIDFFTTHFYHQDDQGNIRLKSEIIVLNHS